MSAVLNRIKEAVSMQKRDAVSESLVPLRRGLRMNFFLPSPDTGWGDGKYINVWKLLMGFTPLILGGVQWEIEQSLYPNMKCLKFCIWYMRSTVWEGRLAQSSGKLLVCQFLVWGKTWETQCKEIWDRSQRNTDKRSIPAKIAERRVHVSPRVLTRHLFLCSVLE